MKQGFRLPDRFSTRLKVILALALALIAAWVLWRFGGDILTLVEDESALRAWVSSLGWIGPLALVGVNVLQIVVAPIPGYAVYFVAGYLFGSVWGSIWGSVGLLAGGMTAMWLARIYGRPFVERMLGAERMARWERHTHSDSTWVWGLLLLSPVGDTPYLLAGLSTVGFRKVLLLTIITRVPFAVAAAAVGAGLMYLTWWQIAAVAAGAGLPLLILMQYRNRLSPRLERILHKHAAESGELP
jgi:uncharacterized membrane protein YdjX (TVP38/TMEM64 family)